METVHCPELNRERNELVEIKIGFLVPRGGASLRFGLRRIGLTETWKLNSEMDAVRIAGHKLSSISPYLEAVP
jgi:hypothetical protein